MKILQLIQKKQFRGAEIFACQLSNELINLGHDIKMYSLLAGDSDLPFMNTINIINADIKRRYFDLQAWRCIDEIIKVYNPSFIQANAGDTLKYAVFSKLFYKWKTPIIFRNANKMSDFIDSKTKYIFNKWLLNQTTHIISVSNECRNDLIQFFKINSNKVSSITIGIDTTHTHLLSDDLLPIFAKGPVLLNVASFVPEKNHFGLIEIFRKIKSRNEDLQLVLVGDGQLKDNVSQYINKIGLNNCIHLLGTRHDILSIMKASYIFLLPSLIEGLPGVILESMYAGLPVIAYNVGGIQDIVLDYSTGRLIKKNDSVSFIKAIDELLYDNELRMRIIDNARDLVLNHYKNKDIALQFQSIYKKLLVD